MKNHLFFATLGTVMLACVAVNLQFLEWSHWANLISALFCSAAFGWTVCLWFVSCKFLRS